MINMQERMESFRKSNFYLSLIHPIVTLFAKQSETSHGGFTQKELLKYLSQHPVKVNKTTTFKDGTTVVEVE